MGTAESGGLLDNLPDTCNLKDPPPPRTRKSRKNVCDPDSDCSTATPCCRSQDSGVIAEPEFTDTVTCQDRTPSIGGLGRVNLWTEYEEGTQELCGHSRDREALLDLPLEFGEHPLEPPPCPGGGGGGGERDEATAQDWVRRLLRGTEVALDGETVRAVLDSELGCLEIREHDLLFPLAELRTCVELTPEGEDQEGSVYELEVAFADFDLLIFQFDEAEQRAGFAGALDALAAEARRGQLPEGGGSSRVDLVD